MSVSKHSSIISFLVALSIIKLASKPKALNVLRSFVIASCVTNKLRIFASYFAIAQEILNSPTPL